MFLERDGSHMNIENSQIKEQPPHQSKSDLYQNPFGFDYWRLTA